MKHICFCLVFLLAISAARGEWSNSLKPKGEPAGEFPIARNGQPACAIELPINATTEEKKAAGDLAHWFKEMTGAEIPLNSATAANVISIETERDLGDEGIRIALEGNRLQLAGGTTRGVINAVYAFLEEDLGCRFYTDESIRLPHAKTLIVKPVNRKYIPRLRLRDPFYKFAFDPVWSLRNRTNAPDAKVPEEYGGNIDYDDMFVHTAATLVPPAKYFKTHPEYFMLDKSGKRQPWQLCATNPDVIKIATETVLAHLRKHPHTEIISVSKNDSGGDQLCQCDRCKKLRQAEGSEMANQLVLVNGVAEAVEKQYPNVVIDTLAYLDTVPVPKTMRPRHNVVIRLCNDSGAWNTPFTPAAKLPIAKITAEWAKACKRLYIWDYHVNFSHYLAPMPNVEVMADNIRFWIDNNAEGVMLQAGYQGPAAGDELKSWVTSKILWDPSRDEKALVQDFLEGHYGKAAPAMIEYQALLNKSAADHPQQIAHPPGGIRFPMTISYLSKDFIQQATEIFKKARELAQDDPTLLKRVERAELPILYVQCVRGPEFTGADNYAHVVSEFERIARQEKVQYLEEGGADFERKLAEYKKKIPKPATAPAAAAQEFPSYKVISRGPAAYSYQAFPDACRLKNGDILCVFYAGYGHVSLEADDFPNGGRICMVRSSDEGKTWTSPQVLYDDKDDNRDPHIAQLSDGSLICTFFSWQHKAQRFKSFHDFNWKTFSKIAKNTGAQFVRSSDGGKTWESRAHGIAKDWVCSAPVRQLPGGACLLGLYGGKEDQRSFGGVIESDDLCRTWKPVVQIPQPDNISLDAETDLIRLKDGRLFAALRSSKDDMHYSTSDDGGKTWSLARDIGFHAHCPHLNRLSTGEIILSHRLPQTSIHVSRDECKTWQGPYLIDSCIGAYPSTVELKDHSVLIVYYSEGPGSAIRAKRFRLTDGSIEFLPL